MEHEPEYREVKKIFQKKRKDFELGLRVLVVISQDFLVPRGISSAEMQGTRN